ncbi:glycosyl hydrolase catalytic core-domain-containing protein [Lentinula lateritia]|uniref:Glycosyl hydrolase catalytic core-domain-containing protein n=1 Tax=Lentinula aff. lateritia TaxID=2804960 RepID=A0ACC1U519_9AGAR|nr:glycosyl hydrolase catalytic core-domain-containing protein [Lentinula aff. lateritia]KAJ3853019.1 glycosyl hydrolase catalytic core-domain-containing protein [Lentinula lateritia]
MAHKLLNLLALTSLAIMACSFGAEPVNALSNTHHVRDGLRGHDALAKRKRSVNGKRCKVRSAPADSSTASSTDSSSVESSSTDYTPAPITTSTWSDSSSSTWSSTSTSAPAATSSASSSSSGSGKGCLAWPNGDQSYLGDYKTDKTGLIYTWGETAPSNAASLGFTFAPQLWGNSNMNAFASTVVAGYAKYALFLNEPNEPGQSNIDATAAAGLWIKYMEPLKALGYQVGSAATSSNPNGMTWTTDFFTACNGGCNPDFVAVHWYDITADGFMSYVEQWYSAFNLPIWVTEFAYQDFNGNDQGDLATIQSFMGEVTAWMDQQDYVQYYCWFGAMLDMQNVNPLNTLMNPDGSPSDLGEQFLYSG